MIKEKTCKLDDNQILLCERITELEKVNNINKTPRRATEEDFSIEGIYLNKYKMLKNFKTDILLLLSN